VFKVLVLVALFALATYWVVRTIQRTGGPSAGRLPGRPQGRSHRPPARPVAPDDDIDFLRDLDRKRKHPDDPDALGG
jgi:hypothetical protein